MGNHSFFVKRGEKVRRNAKASLSEQEKLSLLKKYVTVKTDVRLRNRLRYAGFYRLRLYGRFLLSKSNVIKTKPSEDMLYNLYDFDEKLRLLLFVFCKKAEIRLKTCISACCTEYEGNPAFYLAECSYTPSKSNNDKLSKEKNIKLFPSFLEDLCHEEHKIRTDAAKYPELHEMRPKEKTSARLPADVLFSYLDFGSVSRLYSYLRGDLRKAVLKYGYSRQNYGKQTTKQFDTWLDAIRYLRNSCAHHNMLVGKTSNIILPEFGEQALLPSNTDLFSRLYALKKVLTPKDGEALVHGIDRLVKHSKIDVCLLGILPKNWHELYKRIAVL